MVDWEDINRGRPLGGIGRKRDQNNNKEDEGF
jgi:hypothetical protein